MSHHLDKSSQADRMRQIEASEFEFRCLSILDEMAATGEEIIITKQGLPVARLTAPVRASGSYPQEILRGTVVIRGDIV